jgi:hypothetical protein
MSLMPVRSLSEIAADIEREWMPNIAGMAQPCVRAARARTDYWKLTIARGGKIITTMIGG